MKKRNPDFLRYRMLFGCVEASTDQCLPSESGAETRVDRYY